MILPVAHESFRHFELEDRPLLETAFRKAAFRLCEYSFATQFCWRSWNESRWAPFEDWILVRYREHGQDRFLCPIGPSGSAEVIEACFRRLDDLGSEPRVDFVPEAVRVMLDKDSRFRFEPDQSNDDYVYRREDLAEFPGKKFARKRNHVARFLRNASWSFDKVDSANMSECLGFLDDWCVSHGCEEDPRLDYEVEALRTCLGHMDALGQSSFVLRAQGGIVGMTLGELMSDDTLVVHYEKAYPEHDGAYQMLSREFARTAPTSVVWIDREQDMGVEGLRQSKLSFFPDHMQRCWIVRPS